MAHMTPEHVHETTDAKVKPLVIFLLAMTLAVIVSFLITNVLFDFMSQRAETKGNPVSPVQVINEQPSGPVLQVVPGLDWRAMKAENAERLESYGWVDEGAGVAHIPIEAAVDVLLEQGVPVRGETEAAAESAE